MRRWSLLALSTIFEIITANFNMCHARRYCVDTTSFNKSTDLGHCKVFSRHIEKTQNLAKLMHEMADLKNSFVIAVTSPEATGLLKNANALGNRTAIWYNHHLALKTYGSLELIFGAVPVAIDDFCRENNMSIKFLFW